MDEVLPPLSLDYAILAFLDSEPMSGYELKEFFDQSIPHFCSASQSYLYCSLSKMENAGRISHDAVEQDGKPDRKVYELTAEGQAALHDWLAGP